MTHGRAKNLRGDGLVVAAAPVRARPRRRPCGADGGVDAEVEAGAVELVEAEVVQIEEAEDVEDAEVEEEAAAEE